MDIFDYGTLKEIWWLLVAILLIGFAIMDGQDMGVGALLPFIGKDDVERRVIINTVAPHWEGNQVWFITGAGALFAAWPLIYATSFYGFYWAMFAALCALFLRPVGFDYRSKIAGPKWRNGWDWGLFVGGFVPPIIFGVAVGNLLLGVPFHFNSLLMSFYEGTFWQLLNPFGLLCGVLSSLMITFHGGVYLAHRTEGVIAARVKKSLIYIAPAALIIFTIAGIWVATNMDGYVITSPINPNALPDPLDKTVIKQAGAWLNNYRAHPILWLVPAMGYIGFIAALLLTLKNKTLAAFIASSLGLAGIILTPAVAMFPFVMPSSTHLNSSLTMWDGVSGQLTLGIMLVAVVIFLPLVVIYTGWAYKIMRGKVTQRYVVENSSSVY